MAAWRSQLKYVEMVAMWKLIPHRAVQIDTVSDSTWCAPSVCLGKASVMVLETYAFSQEKVVADLKAQSNHSEEKAVRDTQLHTSAGTPMVVVELRLKRGAYPPLICLPWFWRLD